MASITMKKIYKELIELKKKVERLELLITLPEEELNDTELLELKQISREMKEGEQNLLSI